MKEYEVKVTATLDTSKIEQQIKDLDGGKIIIEADANSATKEVEKVDKQLVTAKKSAKSFGDTLGKSFNIVSSAAIAAKSIQAIGTATRDAIDAVKDIDNAITDLRMATGESYEGCSRLVQGYNALGKSMGATTVEVANSANAWLRQGKAVGETNDLIKSSIMLSKIGNISTENATTYLTATLNGFKLQADEAYNVISKLSAVDLQSASDAGGIAVSLSKTASAANMANLSLDKTIGMIATIKEVTQDSDEAVGNALKSMLSRINSIRAGKFVDEETGEALNDVEKVLNKVGISMRDANNQFLSTELILDNVNKRWGDFDENTKRAIATAVAGTYQYNKFIALMENYASAIEYANIATNSAGTAETKFAAYLDSIEAKTKSLQAAFESLATNTFSSGLIGGIVEAITQLVTFLDKTNLLKSTLAGIASAKAIKTFATLATGIYNATLRMNDFNSALSIVKTGNLGESQMQKLVRLTSNLSKSQLNAVISSKKLTVQQRMAILTANGMSKAEAKAALQAMNLAGAEGKAALSTTTLSGALKGLWATLKSNPLILVASVITAVVTAVSALSDAAEKAEAEAIEKAQKSKEVADAYREEYDQITGLIKKYKELAESETQDSSTRSEIKGIQEDIVELVGSQADGLDLVNGKLDEQLDKLYKIQSAQSDISVSSARKAYEDARNEFDEYDWKDANWFYDTVMPDPDNQFITIDYWGDNDGRNQGLEIIDKAWRDMGYGTTSVGEVGEGLDTFSMLAFNAELTAQERIDAINAAITALETDGNFDFENSELWSSLVALRDALTGSDGAYTKQVNAAANLLNSLILDSIDDTDIESYNGYIAYRNNLIATISNDDSIKDAISEGLLTGDDIATAIDSQLGSMPQYEEYYTEWCNNLKPEIATIVQEVKDAFYQNLVDKGTNGNFSTLFANQFAKWVDSLTCDDKKIIYDLYLNTDTADYALEDWQNALANYKIPEENKISFAELIEDTDADNEFVDKISEYKEKMATLDEAYASRNDEDFDPTELYLQFPELASADDLGAGILQLKRELTGGKDELGQFTGIYKVFKDQFGNLKTDEDRAALTNLMNAVISTEAAIEATDFTDAMSGVQKLSAGLDQLDKIYLDILNKEDFDFGSILNNDDFTKSFGELSSYNAFIETIANSPDDINACQSAFNTLVFEYINASGALKNLTDDTRDATIAFLEQNGVTNAAAVVDRALAVNKELLALRSSDVAKMTGDEIVQLFKEAEAGSVTQQALAELAIEKYNVNANLISTSKDIDQLISLANAANATTASLENLQKAKSYMAQAESLRKQAGETNVGDSAKRQMLAAADQYEADAKDLSNPSQIEFGTINPDDFKASYSGGTSTKDYRTKSSSSDESEAFDWIEIAFSRIQSAIKRVQGVATSAFNSLKTRLTATGDEISLVTKEIHAQEAAYKRYMQQANSVGLSPELAEKVRNGTIDISKYDSETQKLIKDYQTWYEKATSCSDAVQQLNEDLATLYQNKFNDIQSDFENQLSLLEHESNTYETAIDTLETKGYLGSAKYYSALKNVESQKLTVLNSELAALEKSLAEAMASGEIAEGSEAWYAMKLSIAGVKEEIAQSTQSLIGFDNALHEIEWGHFDYAQERISRIHDEAGFLIDLLSNSDLHTDKGQLTDEGMATMGLHSLNYNTYMAQADDYANEILEIDKELAKDPYNTKLIERREELLDLQQDSILAAEDEKQAIVALVEEGINLELQAMQDLIDKYTESLDSAKDLYEYQKKIEEQTANIASLQKQLSAYENDLTEETRAKVQKLTVELAKAEEELAESEYEQYISDQNKLLDELYLEYETILNQRLDNVDDLIGDMITAVNDNSGTINTTLSGIASDVGYEMSELMKSIWNGETNQEDGVVSEYGEGFSSKLTSIQQVLESIKSNTAAMVEASDEEAQETLDSDTTETTSSAPAAQTSQPSTTPEAHTTTPSTSEKTITVGGKINAQGAKIYSYAGDTNGKNQLFSKDPIYKVLDEKNGYLMVRHHKSSSGVTGWFKKSDVKAYKTGGLVDYTGLAKVDGTPGKPELMLNAEDTKNFLELRDLLRVLSSQSLTIGSSYGFGSPTLSGVTDISKMLSSLRTANGGTFGTTIGDVEITIPIERVDDYNDFVTKLRNDPKFENMLLDVTIGRLAGGSSLAKNKYKW